MTFNYAEASLDDLDTRGAELRTDLADLYDGERSETFIADKTALLDEVALLDNQFTIAYAQGRREALGRMFQAGEGTGTLAAHTDAPAREQYRSGGERIMAASQMQEWIGSGLRMGKGSEFAYTLEDTSIDDFGLRADPAFTEFGTGGPGNVATTGVNTLLPVGQPIAPVPRQAMLFMRDLIPVQRTTLIQVPYVRELTPTTSEALATTVAEAGLKPDAQPDFSPAVAYVTVIAANVSPSKQLWEDAPVVAAYLNQRLPYLVKFREDAEFLNGSGTYPDIQGITNTTGIQSQAGVAGETAITVGLSIAKVENVDGAATAVVMNPTDAWNMYTKRAAGGSGTFDAGTPFASLPMTIWGLPVKRSRAYTAGSALVGDFQRGAMILDREQVNVQVYPQHADYVTHNLVLVQCEERVGLMVPRPDLFVEAGIVAAA